MKSSKTIAKIFKGCKVISFDIVDGVVHVFRMRSKTGADMTYKFDVSDISEPCGRLVWKVKIEERRRMDAIRMALMSLVDGDTRIPPYAQARAKEIIEAGKTLGVI